ncbi:cytokine receptor common subunit beta-like [Cetorhinus maximus]
MFGKERTSFLCSISILALTIAHCAVYDVVNSLQCYTDYSSEIECQWAEDPMARQYIPMDLYYKKEIQGTMRNYTLQKCNSRRSPENTSSSDLHWRCTIMDTSHAISFTYNYVFKPERPVKLNKRVRLLENIKPQPPFNLSVAVTEEGDYLLSWKTIYTANSSNKLFGKLQYDIKYKRSWQPWENSVSETVQSDDRPFHINKSSLVTSETYVACVRAKPLQQDGYGGHWSEWSSEVQWDVTENANHSQTAEAEVMPRNLQCTYDGIQEIECTWEVTRESSKYFKFNLHYGKAYSVKTKVCEQSVILHTFPHLIVHRCNIPVDDEEDLNDYNVFLKLVEPTIIFEPYRNIKFKAPFNLTIKQLPDYNYQLNWLTKNTDGQSEYEIHYKKAEDSWENSEVKAIPQDTKSCQLPKHLLDFSSRYRIRIRAKVKCGQGPFTYCGPWSDWSEEISLETDPDHKPIVIAAVVILMILIILIRPFFCLIKRKKRSWLDSIPDPAKSKLFLKESQRGLLGYWFPAETIAPEESNICQVVADESLDTSPQFISKEEAEFTQIKKERGMSSPPMTGDQVGQGQLYRETGTAEPFGEAPFNVPVIQSDPSDYNGPYLFNYQALSKPCLELKNGFNQNESSFKCGQGAPGYVKLPENASESQQVPDQAHDEQTPPLPTSAYVLDPSQPMSSSPSATGYHVHTDNTARTCLKQSMPEQPTVSVSSYVLCPPLTNSNPTSSPGANSGYVHTKGADISSSSHPVPGSDATANSTAGQRPVVSNCGAETLAEAGAPIVDEGNTQRPPSWPDVSQEKPLVTPWQPDDSVNYVLTPPGEQLAHWSSPPKQATLITNKDHGLSAECQQGGVSDPLNWRVPIHGPEHPYPPKLQVDPQKPITKEEALSLANMQNETPNVILYQQGAKPLLLQQIGDYCFIPRS